MKIKQLIRKGKLFLFFIRLTKAGEYGIINKRAKIRREMG